MRSSLGWAPVGPPFGGLLCAVCHIGLVQRKCPRRLQAIRSRSGISADQFGTAWKQLQPVLVHGLNSSWRPQR